MINAFHILPSFLVNLFSLQSYQIFLERSITTKKENEPKLRSPENDKNIFYATKDM
ncbi:hypothetical protein PNI0153_01750 [Streptococcus pneumoniae PNI0153]|nr:hypothetical protein PNI0153_01750 [Streptococcus pneumoniae PNI0153]